MSFTETEISFAVAAYREAALFTEDAEVGDDATFDDFADTALTETENNVVNFFENNAEMIKGALETPGYDIKQVGHDLWLTRNGHGVGFWDRGLGDYGTALTEAAEALGHSHLVLGDDDKIHTA